MANSLGSAKQQFLWQLHQRVGHPLPAPSGVTPFEFEVSGVWNHTRRTDLWRNIDQLEAVVEFYANFTEPWGGGAPLKPGDAGYKTVSLRDPAGQKATVAGNVVTLDGNPDLSEVIPDSFVRNPAGNATVGAAAGGTPPTKGTYPPQTTYLYDTLLLDADTVRTKKTYRIIKVLDEKTVQIDAAPKFSTGVTTSTWKINRRPIIVIIDPLGPRPPVRSKGDVTLRGTAASVVGPDAKNAALTVLSLDGKPKLDLVNAGFDTIRLDTDTVTSPDRPGCVYRIVSTGNTSQGPTVTVEGKPSLSGGASAWQIPAGVGGVRVSPFLYYDLGPQYAPNPKDPDQKGRGFDHYDAALFLVHHDKIVGHDLFRWSSYTSRVYGTFWNPTGDWKQDLSSIRGNARYYYSSYLSTNAWKNFAFAVVDYTATPPSTKLIPDAKDSVAQGRFYSGTPHPPGALDKSGDIDVLDPKVFVDAGGKTAIRLHLGSTNGEFGTGSAGCLVSPEYFNMRQDLLKLFEADYAEHFGPKTLDAEVHKVTNVVKRTQSETLWKTFNRSNWDGKVVGTLWLVRPDEHPITGK